MSVERAAYIAGLRQLADLLTAVPELPLPDVSPVTGEMTWQVGRRVAEPGPEIARIARLLPCRLDKNDPDSGEHGATYYQLSGTLFGLGVRVWGFREQVCEKVITGSKPVTRLVPDPAAPMVEVTEDVQTFEWRCGPLLAQTPARAESSPAARADGHPDRLPPAAGLGVPEMGGAW